MSNLIAPSKTLGYSSIFLDFLAGQKPASAFYPAGQPGEVAAKLDGQEFNRRALCDILTRQNRSYGASEKTFANVEKLKQADAVCLFAGQQAGLFGGPMLVIHKALSLVKAAAQYTQQLGRPVIPIFWIAGDDHDFEEVNHTFVMSRSSELTRIAYSTPPAEESPVSEVMFADGEELNAAKEQLKTALGESDFTADLYDIIDKAYTGQDSYVSAFGKLMAAIMSSYGLVFFSPGDAQAKKLAVGLFRDIIDKGDELQRRLSETSLQITSHGYHLQVEKAENATHLFYDLNGRKPVMRDGDSYLVGDQSLTKEELLRRIEDHPEKFSPDVMTRPVMQSYLFPVVSQKGGAAEIAYLAQIHDIFELFDLTTPFYRARPSLTIVEKRMEQMMRDYEIGFEELTGDIEQVINRVLAISFPEDIESKFNEFRSHLIEHFQQFSSRSLSFDPALKNFADQTMGKIDYAVKAFENKVFSSHKKKSSQTRERIYRLHHTLYPNRNFQERALNITYFLSKYGMGFIDFLYGQIDCDQNAHQLVNMSEYEV